jgi:hypothetical protein
MRIPWLIVGTVLGVAAMGVLLPMVSDSTGFAQGVVILFCLFGGVVVGFLLNDFRKEKTRPPKKGPEDS